MNSNVEEPLLAVKKYNHHHHFLLTYLKHIFTVKKCKEYERNGSCKNSPPPLLHPLSMKGAEEWGCFKSNPSFFCSISLSSLSPIKLKLMVNKIHTFEDGICFSLENLQQGGKKIKRV